MSHEAESRQWIFSAKSLLRWIILAFALAIAGVPAYYYFQVQNQLNKERRFKEHYDQALLRHASCLDSQLADRALLVLANARHNRTTFSLDHGFVEVALKNCEISLRGIGNSFAEDVLERLSEISPRYKEIQTKVDAPILAEKRSKEAAETRKREAELVDIKEQFLKK